MTPTSAAPSCLPVSRSLLAVVTSSQRPLDAYLFHHQDSLPRQGAMLVPPALLGHPRAKRGVVRVLLRHIAVPVLALEGQQLLSLASVSNCCPPRNRGTAAWSTSSESRAAHSCPVPSPLHPSPFLIPHPACLPVAPSRLKQKKTHASFSYRWLIAACADAGCRTQQHASKAPHASWRTRKGFSARETV